MKIYLNNPKESWVVDRFRNEWIKFNPDLNSRRPKSSDIIWLIAPWTWNKVSKKYLNEKTVICTIHHIDEDKFSKNEENNFKDRDSYIDYYHAISKKTEEQLRKYTNKKIFTLPFWVNEDIWFQIKDKEALRKNFGFESNDYLVGSFQRDTEGSDLISPKLSKGPDQFIEIVKNLKKINNSLKVVLTGKRRNYLINQLTKNNIPFKYFEMSDYIKLNELYNCLDLYIVSSRVEGGPQAILECGITKTPIISTDVGIASQILSKESIFNMENYLLAKPNIDIAYENSVKYTLPKWNIEYRNLLLNLL
jgi:glycosyltransferase involved in cell wall biosynthesis